MSFDINTVWGSLSVYKIWDTKRKDWWSTPAGKASWWDLPSAKRAVKKHIGRLTKRHRLIECACIVFREVE